MNPSDAAVPIQPISSISSPLTPLFSHINFSQVIAVVFALFFLFWLIYTLVASYHWLKYSHKSSVAIPAIITHILVSGFLALYAVSGLQ